MAILVDSSVFIEIERRGQSLDGLEAFSQGEPIALAAISISELLVGAHRADNLERRAQRERFVDRLLERFAVLSFDTQVARIHSGLAANLQISGQTIGAHDLMIAATAIAHGYGVLTHNLRDFQRIPGLDVQRM